MQVQVDDGIRPFVEESMSSIDSTLYTKEDFEVYFNNQHLNFVHLNKEGTIIAFACILYIDNKYHIVYTWCDKTISGKKAYLKGIDYLIDRLGSIELNNYAINHINKIKRKIVYD